MTLDASAVCSLHSMFVLLDEWELNSIETLSIGLPR